MDDERVEFRAGRDHGGFASWVAGLVVDREQRDDGQWLKVLPSHSESDEDALWVNQDDTRTPIG